VIGPGLANWLLAGLPPGKTQEYAEIVPVELVPVPEKFTVWPGVIEALLVGLVIAPVGGWSFGASESCTNRASEGTPAELRRNNI